MNREEAIRILNNIKPLNTTKTIPAYMKGQAFEMAIKALEQNESAEEWYKLFVEKLEQEQEPKTEVLDKIRAEIEENRWTDKNIRIERNALASGLDVALKIIDKYRKEQE